MSVRDSLLRTSGAALGGLGARISALADDPGDGEQGPAGSDGHLDTEDPALFRPMVYGDRQRLHVADTAIINNALINLSSGEVTIGDHAFFGHNVSVLTGTHDINTFGAERQVAVPKSGRDVVIEEGVWVSSNATVVGPCRIGAHAVVGVGSLVLTDVEPYTVVAGNPARVLRTIERPGASSGPTAGADPDPAADVVADQEPGERPGPPAPA